jgi:hypothetical protein
MKDTNKRSTPDSDRQQLEAQMARFAKTRINGALRQSRRQQTIFASPIKSVKLISSAPDPDFNLDVTLDTVTNMSLRVPPARRAKKR